VGAGRGIWRQGLLEYDKVVGIDWAWLAADGAMTKAPLGEPKTGPNPTDRAEGAKRSVLSEGTGIPIGLAHDGANRNDQPLLEPTLTSIPIERPEPTPEFPQGLCLDRGYDSPPMHDLAALTCIQESCRTVEGSSDATLVRTLILTSRGLP
jgi:putative transposase